MRRMLNEKVFIWIKIALGVGLVLVIVVIAIVALDDGDGGNLAGSDADTDSQGSAEILEDATDLTGQATVEISTTDNLFEPGTVIVSLAPRFYGPITGSTITTLSPMTLWHLRRSRPTTSPQAPRQAARSPTPDRLGTTARSTERPVPVNSAPSSCSSQPTRPTSQTLLICAACAASLQFSP